MKPLLYPFVCIYVSFSFRFLEVTQAKSFMGHSGIEGRYYHHEVHLDESNHNDEFFSFVTRPDLDAPRWDVEVFDEDALAPGYWFTAPYSNVAQSTADAPWNAPHIYDANGDLIWSGAPVSDGFTTFDFRVVDLQGQPVLSLVYPRGGKAIIFDETYEIIKMLNMGDEVLRFNEWGLNPHEFMTVERGTKALHLMRVPRRTSKENSEVVDFEGECFAVFDGIKELDTKTWNVTNTWDSEGYIGFDESYTTREPVSSRCGSREPWEYLHANSIDTFPDGDYLLSGRRTNTLYRISRNNGSIIWRLGGRNSDFEMSFKFSGQHAAKVYQQNGTHILISLLDNAFSPTADLQISHQESRGLLIALDLNLMTANLVMEFPHPEGRYTTSRGNMQMLPTGNAWICWSDGSLQSEHTIDGTLVMKARFKAHISSYRTFKFPWIGRPKDPPDVHAAVVDKNGLWYTIVHVSWNGATEVSEWKVYHSNLEGNNSVLMATVPRRGFETSAWTEGYGRFVVAEALDESGAVLGVSQVFSSIPPRNRTQPALEPDAVSKNADSEKQSKLLVVVRTSLPAFVLGIMLGGIVGVLALSTSKRRMESKPWSRFGRWKSTKASYELLSMDTEHDEDNFKLETFDDNVEDGKSTTGER